MPDGDDVAHGHLAVREPTQVSGRDDVAVLDLRIFHPARIGTARVARARKPTQAPLAGWA